MEVPIVSFESLYTTVLKELKQVFESINYYNIENLMVMINNSKRIF